MSFRQIIKLVNKFEIKLAQIDSNVELLKGTVTVTSADLSNAQQQGEVTLNQIDPLDAERLINNRINRDGPTSHMTLIGPKELRDLVASKFKSMTEEEKQGQLRKIVEKNIEQQILSTINSMFLADWKVEGLGKAEKEDNVAYFMVVSWKTGNLIREQLGLPPRDFHVTVGFGDAGDIHGVNKGVTSLV